MSMCAMKLILFVLLALQILSGCTPNMPLSSLPEALPQASQPGLYRGALIDMVLILESQPVYRQKATQQTGNHISYTYTFHDMNGDPVNPSNAEQLPIPEPNRTLSGTTLTVNAPDGAKIQFDVQIPLGAEPEGFALAWAGEDLILTCWEDS